MDDTDRVIVALDGLTEQTALDLAALLKGQCWGFKVNDLLVQAGVRIIKELKQYGRVFADPKLHDIPNTVSNSLKPIVDAGADLITIHSSGGPAMLASAKNAVMGSGAKLLAVTVLTSIDDKTCHSIYGKGCKSSVINFARIAKEAEIDGVVCSPIELSILAQESLFDSLIKVTPGIRPANQAGKDDQKRTNTPDEAINAGASLLVVGRPITQSSDPTAALQSLFDEFA